MAQLTLLGSTVKRIVGYGGNLYHFTEAGVDVHRLSDGARIAYASLANVTAGAVNDNGVYLGTSAAGVYLLSHASVTTGGDRTADLVQTYTTASTPAIQSDAVAGMDGRGTALLVTGAAGADYLPDAATVHSYADAGGCGFACSLGATDIAYAVNSGGAHALAKPTEDWVAGDSSTVGGTVGYAIDLDGGYVNIGAALLPTDGSPWTLEARVKRTGGSATDEYIATQYKNGGAGRTTLYSYAGEFYFFNSGSGTLSFGAVSSERTHLAVTWDGTTLRLYRNGSEVATGGGLDPILNIEMLIGAGFDTDGTSAFRQFFGQIDKVRVWSTVRTASQINDNQDVILSGTETGLVAAYEPGDGSGATLTDIAGSNDGSIIGSATWIEAVVNPGNVQALDYGTDLFIGLDDKLQSHDGSTHTDHTDKLGTVKDVKSLSATLNATATQGLLAYGTADGAGNGQFGVLDLSET